MVGDLGIVAGRMEAASRLLDAGSPRVSTLREYQGSIHSPSNLDSPQSFHLVASTPELSPVPGIEVLAPETSNEQYCLSKCTLQVGHPARPLVSSHAFLCCVLVALLRISSSVFPVLIQLPRLFV